MNAQETLARAKIAGVGVAIVALGFAAYYLYKLSRAGAQLAVDAHAAAVDTTAGVIEHFFPLVGVDSLITYFVRFPDGATHAVNGDEIDKSGYFYRLGIRYKIAQDAKGARVALAA